MAADERRFAICVHPPPSLAAAIAPRAKERKVRGTYSVPFGEGTLSFRVPAGATTTVAEPKPPPPVPDAQAAIEEALRAPCGSDSLERLVASAKPGRVCITATDALPELSETVFPYHFVRAFADPKADADEDGLLSVLEIFNYSKTQVKAFFDEKKLLLTEHALLDDNGDGIGHRDPSAPAAPPAQTPDAKAKDGQKAAEVFFELQSGA